MLNEKAWEDELMRLEARFQISLSSVPRASSVDVKKENQLFNVLKSDEFDGCPKQVETEITKAAVEVMLKARQKTFSGLELNSVCLIILNRVWEQTVNWPSNTFYVNYEL